MIDIIIVAVLAVILGAAARYIYKAKKSGAKCIGCASGDCSGCCPSSNGDTVSGCSCGCGENEV